MLWRLDSHGQCVDASDAWLDFTGTSLSQNLGEAWTSVIHSEDQPALAQALQTAIERGCSAPTRIRARRASGEFVLLFGRIASTPPAADGAGGLVALWIETTTAAAPSNRDDARERLELALEASNIGLWMWDADSNATYLSPTWKAQLGYRDDEIPSSISEWKKRLHPDDRERVLQALDDFLAHRTRSYDVEFRLQHRAGHYRWIQTRGRLFAGAAGKQSRLIGCHVDITEIKCAETALLRQSSVLHNKNEELARKNSELEEFTHVASHDLQEPLRKLQVFTNLFPQDLGGVELPERAKKDLYFINDAAARMQSLVQAILELSRCGRSEMDLRPVDLNTCLDEVMLALSDRFDKSQAVVARSQLPTVLGDATLLAQVLQNLVGNALKFVVPGEQPMIEITNVADGDNWVVGVKDNGIGLKHEYAELIFAPFKRLHSRKEYEGSGIGLAICRKAIERMGGRIWVESEFGQGAHFRFRLPAAVMEPTLCSL